MFRMKFQSADTAAEDDDSSFGDDRDGGCSPHHVPTIYEGRMGKFGKIRRLSSSYDAQNQLTQEQVCVVCPNTVAVTVSEKVIPEEVDLINCEVGTAQDAETHHAIGTDAEVRKDGVKPFTESKNIDHGPNGRPAKDKSVSVTDLHFQPVIRDVDMEIVSMGSQQPEMLVVGLSDSTRSTSSAWSKDNSDSDSQCSNSNLSITEDLEYPKRKDGNGKLNKLIPKKKHIRANPDHDDKFAKPCQEPLLAVHDQEELDLMAQMEAKKEAKRLAEEEKQERQRQQRELRDLANCVTHAPSPGRTFKKSKLKKILRKTGVTRVYRFLKNPFSMFRSHKDYPGYQYPNAREARVIIPKARSFTGCCTTPSVVGCLATPSDTTDARLAPMRNAPRQTTFRPDIQFATVESTQRDVPAWTREQYLRKNARIPERSTYNKDDDEEFGGIEGNNLMNQYFDDDVMNTYDSDSD